MWEAPEGPTNGHPHVTRAEPAASRASLQGIFATHLHHLLEADLQTQHMQYWCMETAPGAGGQPQATMRMVPGTCTVSLALAVAAKSGLPQDVLDRATHFYKVRIAM